MPENDLGLQMESSEIYSFFKIGTRIRTSIYPAVLVLCSVNLAFSQSLFEKLEDTLLYHFIKEAKQCSFAHKQLVIVRGKHLPCPFLIH